MAEIVIFWKPIVSLPVSGPMSVPATPTHAFLLFRNDAGVYTDIARGGPDSALYGTAGRNSGYLGSGAGLGNVLASVEAYDRNTLSPPALGDFFRSSDLANLPQRVLLSGSEADLRALWDRLPSIADAINTRQIPYQLVDFNSNSTVTTFADTLGVPRERIAPPDLSSLGATLAPGHGRNLLEHMHDVDLAEDNARARAPEERNLLGRTVRNLDWNEADARYSLEAARREFEYDGGLPRDDLSQYQTLDVPLPPTLQNPADLPAPNANETLLRFSTERPAPDPLRPYEVATPFAAARRKRHRTHHRIATPRKFNLSAPAKRGGFCGGVNRGC